MSAVPTDYGSGDPYNPDPVYHSTLEYIAPGFMEQVADTQQAGENWWDAALRALTTVGMLDIQRQQVAIELERAKRGLPPLGMYGTPQTGMSTTTILLLGAIGLGAVYMLAKGKI